MTSWAKEEELCHYGVLGMKWGIRRYQNEDGSLTPEGRRRARREYRTDNKEAYEKGRRATQTDRVKRLTENDYIKAMKRVAKDPSNIKNQEKLKRAGNAYKAAYKTAEEAFSDMEKHRDALIKSTERKRFPTSDMTSSAI